MEIVVDGLSMLACLGRNWEAALIPTYPKQGESFVADGSKSLSFPLWLADKFDLRRRGCQRRNTDVTRKHKQNDSRTFDHGSFRGLRSPQSCVTQVVLW